jgi:hypothetical protein
VLKKIKILLISVHFTLRVVVNVCRGLRVDRDFVGRCVVFNRKSSTQYFLTSRCD